MARILITGAGGFVGRELVRQLLDEGLDGRPVERLVLLDGSLGAVPDDRRILALEGDLVDAELRQRALDEDIDLLFHLAGVMGGTAEQNYALSREVNLTATLALIEAAAEIRPGLRIVFTSTIAVLGAMRVPVVNDETPLAPELTYGAHKLMIEIALADLSRRGMVDAVSVRLPGILARPPAPSGMKSAFLSDVYHALLAGRPITAPVGPEGTIWAMSVEQVARNLRHAAVLDSSLMPVGRAVTLPAVRTGFGAMVNAIAAETGADASLVSYRPDAALQELFANQPPLETPAAERAGFRHDGSIEALVARAVAHIRADEAAGD